MLTNTNMLLKVSHFEGSSNRSNVDELVINSTSGCNCNNYKLDNNLISGVLLFQTQFRLQIAFTYNYLYTKFGVLSSKFNGDVCDSLKHI